MTGLGIVLGVASAFGVLLTNGVLNRGLEQQVLGYPGSPDVTAVRQFPAGSEPESSLDIVTDSFDRLQGMEDVEAVARVSSVGPLLRSSQEPLSSASNNELRPRLIGVDSLAFERAPIIDKGQSYHSGAPEVVLNQAAVSQLGVEVGDIVYMDVPSARAALRMVGIAPDSASGLSAGFTSYETLSERTDTRVSTLHIYLKDSVRPDVWVATHNDLFPDLELAYSLTTREVRQLLSAIQTAMTAAAAIVIVISALLIYLMFSLEVAHETRLYGTLHALGARSGQIASAVAAKAVILALPAAGFGLISGLGVAMLLMHFVARVVPLGLSPLTVTAPAVVTAVGAGFVATLLGSWFPARRAGRFSAVEAMRRHPVPAHQSSRTKFAGIALAAGGITFHLYANGTFGSGFFESLGFVPPVLVLFGVVFLLPTLVGVLGRAVHAFGLHTGSGLKNVALMHIAREPSRSAYMLGLVMLVLAMTLILGITYASIGRAVDRWTTIRFGADLLVYASDDLPASAEAQVRRLGDVEAVASLRLDQVGVIHPTEAGRLNLILIDPDAFFEVAGFPWASGSETEARAALQRGGAVLLPASTASRLNLERGDHLTLSTEAGPSNFTLAGTYASTATGPEVGVVASMADGRRYFGDHRSNVLYVNLRPDVPQDGRMLFDDPPGESRSVERLVTFDGSASSVRSLFGEKVFVTEGLEVKAEARRHLTTYVGLFLVILLLAAFTGSLGLANTMAISIVQRYREIGMLQALGADARGVRRMILTEAGALVAVAFLVSLPVSLWVSEMLLSGAEHVLGFRISLVYPWPWMMAVGAGAVVLGLTVSVIPSRRASRLTIVDLLRLE